MTIDDPLSIWLDTELRRAEAELAKARKESDEFICSSMGEKTGARVKSALSETSAISVALADATIAKASEYIASVQQFENAQKRVVSFSQKQANKIIPLAFVVSGETGTGGSVVKHTSNEISRLTADIRRIFDLAKLHAKAQRAPSVKKGRPPSDERILAKADEMKARGMTMYDIAKKMRHEPGFENAGTMLVRDLIIGRWKPTGRPRKARGK